MLIAATDTRAQDFADQVIGHAPAPGQFVNQAAYNDPARALGAPVGGGTVTPNNTKLVSLGGFGGSITLGFSETVLDDPCNPMGLDAIVFGNALWSGGDSNRRSCEAAVIEISRDVNGNGLADDPWYLIPGSSIALPATAQCQAWDNNGGTPTPPTNLAWYPSGHPSMYATCAFELPTEFAPIVVENPLGPDATSEAYFGYADFTPTLILGDTDSDGAIDDPALAAADFYTVPDSPFFVGISMGSGGGDAFDIAWAVDAATGAPADLNGCDFVRISTGLDALRGPLGEVSAEIGGVARVRARLQYFDLTGDGRADVEDLYVWELLRSAEGDEADLDRDGAVGDPDRLLEMKCVRKAEMPDVLQ